ncbi:MAG TPA: FHA domain-containing protein [Anaerolineales bacterium]|nr:FHA domain-containing protein [Anaerolineales bacterium]
MNCTNCGSLLTRAEKYCSNCGTRVPEPGSGPDVSLEGFGLYVVAGPGVGRSFSFGEATRLGRGVDNDVRLYDPEVSREHAVVYRYDGGYAITDLGSANGTFLNDVRLSEPAWIRPGDTLRLGAVELQVTAPGVPVVKRRAAAPGNYSSAPALNRTGLGGLPGWLLWLLMGFGVLLASAGVVGMIAVLGN